MRPRARWSCFLLKKHMQYRLLFLDFDGVTHPCTAGTFIHLAKLTPLLRAHPEILVVLSTSWRLEHSLEELRLLFKVDLRERVIGTTPALPDTSRAQRFAEIRQWLAQNCVSQTTPWSVLDDDATLFPPDCPQLVLCDTVRGMRQPQIDELARKLGVATGAYA